MEATQLILQETKVGLPKLPSHIPLDKSNYCREIKQIITWSLCSTSFCRLYSILVGSELRCFSMFGRDW